MSNLIKVYKSVISKNRYTIISVDDIASNTGLDFFTTQSILRALAADNIIKLASICDSDESPSIGFINGRAKNPEYFFVWTHKHKSFEKQNKI